MREPENIRAISQLGVDVIGLIFYPRSPRYVRSISIRAGIVPDNPSLSVNSAEVIDEKPQKTVRYAGVFVNEMPQTVITHAYNYRLDFLQFHGNESPTYIENLKRTIIPDIMPNVKIIKAISIREAADVDKWRQYSGCVDMLLFDNKCKTVGGSGEHFDWSVLDGYDGDIPFLLSGGIGPEDTDNIRNFNHRQCVGFDLNSKFEDAPALKNVEKVREFLKAINRI